MRPDDPDFPPLYGWLRRGPDFTTPHQKWVVYPEPVPGEIDVPVTIVAGHVEIPGPDDIDPVIERRGAFWYMGDHIIGIATDAD